MDTTLLAALTPRTRRRHSTAFKEQAVAACLQPGVSIAGIALANQLNANMLRSWVKAHRDQQGNDLPANVGTDRAMKAADYPAATFVPITLKAPESLPASNIQIEIRRQQTVVQVTWPVTDSTACAHWLREILR